MEFDTLAALSTAAFVSADTSLSRTAVDG